MSVCYTCSMKTSTQNLRVHSTGCTHTYSAYTEREKRIKELQMTSIICLSVSSLVHHWWMATGAVQCFCMRVWLQENGSRRRDFCAWAARRSGENLATAGQGNATTAGRWWQLTARRLLAEGACCLIWWSLLALASSPLVQVALPGPCSQTGISLLSFLME